MPMSLTQLHVAISLVAIATGAVSLWGVATNRKPGAVTAVFLATTILTSVTGFLFPISSLTPAVVFGLISLPLLAAAVAALYAFHLRGAWRPVFVVCASLALYLNAFVGVFQAFQKLGALQVLAPTQSEPPFIVAQVILIALVLTAATLGVKRFAR